MSELKPAYQDSLVTIYHGDVRDVLREMPDESVNCVVTSPPYWGLRDYGTAKWEGGDAGCDHRVGRFERGGLSSKQASNHGSGGDEAANECPKCGARRVDQQIGLEATPELYISKMVEVFREVRRVLRKDGTLWLNIGDSYSSGGRDSYDSTLVSKTSGLANHSAGGKRYTPDWLKPKDLVGIPWMLAFALRADGWYLRQDIIWAKPNPMPESVTDRCTKSHEYIFLLTTSATYYYDAEAIKEETTGNAHARGDGVNPKSKATGKNYRQCVDRDPAHLAAKRPKQNESFSGAVNEIVSSRNKRSVWNVATQPFPEAHFATFPQDLIKPCILAGCPEGGTVLDPFMGSGTTGLVAKSLHCKAIGVELNKSYIQIAARRLRQEVLIFA